MQHTINNAHSRRHRVAATLFDLCVSSQLPWRSLQDRSRGQQAGTGFSGTSLPFRRDLKTRVNIPWLQRPLARMFKAGFLPVLWLTIFRDQGHASHTWMEIYKWTLRVRHMLPTPVIHDCCIGRDC